ncbi:MAG: hypothetical protein KDC98_22665 [Planctomycetes bacterium]|nr:hypothetical protein [Planctomycetota bacterium]
MNEPGLETTALPAATAAAIARTLAITIRSAAMYPEDHPRTRLAADECISTIRECGGIALTVHDRKLYCNGTAVDTEAHIEWIAERIRLASLRGIAVAVDCSDADLLRFARSIAATPKPAADGELTEWPEDHPRLRLLPMQLEGTFGGGEGPGQDQPGVAAAVLPGGQGMRQPTRADSLGVTAGRIARTYFGHSSGLQSEVEPAPVALPSGRPEDEVIGADLDALLDEIAALPPAAQPEIVREEIVNCDSKPLARQLLGVYLHLYFTDAAQSARALIAQPLRRTIAALGPEAGPILDPYLAPNGENRTTNRDRLELLELIDQANQHRLIAARGYIDRDLVIAGFPDILSLFSRAFGDTPQAREILREAGRSLGESLEETTFAATGIATDQLSARVVRSLLAAGGDVAGDTIRQATASGRLDLFAAILDHLEHATLPPAERLALATLTAQDGDAGSFLELACACAESGEVNPELRQRSGELLRRRAREARHGGNRQHLLKSIEDLAVVPDRATLDLLGELARRPHWYSWCDSERDVRAKAKQIRREVLQDLRS